MRQSNKKNTTKQNQQRKQWFQFLCLSCIFLLIAGCGSGGVSSSDPEKIGVLQSPAIINTDDLPADGTVTTFLTIDDEAPQEITLTDNSYQFSLAEFATGEHTFFIEFKFASSKYPSTTLATGTVKINVVAGNNAITFVEADYTFPDSNNDTQTNLDALKANLDPNACILGSSKLGNCSLTL